MIEYMEASKKDVIKYKTKWLFKIIYRLYLRYIELYDFSDLI